MNLLDSTTDGLDERERIKIECMCTESCAHYVEKVIDKVSNKLNGTYAGWISILQGLQKIFV